MVALQIIDILARVCDSDEIRQNPDIDLFEAGLLDSFGIVQFLLALEQELSIYISITEFDPELWATPNKIVAYLEEKNKQ